MHERPPVGVDSMPPYVVVCLDVDAALEAEGHHHVRALATRDPDGGETRWSVVQAIAAIRDGERFVAGDAPRATAVLEPALCPRCPTITLVTDPPDAPIRRCD